MFYFLIFLCIFTTLLFFPVPLKLSMKYINNNFSFFLYRKEIFSINTELSPENLEKFKDKLSNINKNKPEDKNSEELSEDESNTKKKFTNELFSKEVLLSTVRNLNCSHYKPDIDFSIDLSYGLENAAITAILYGYISMLFPLLYNFLEVFFNIADFNFDLKPVFKKIKSNFYCKSIIYISLANITYIIILLIKSFFKYKKENSSFLGGLNYGKSSN